MTIVSASDFRSNMSKYLGMVDSGEKLVLKSRKGEYSLNPVKRKQKGTKPRRDITAKVCQALKDWKEYLDTGKSDKFRPLDEFLDELRNSESHRIWEML